MGRPAKGWRLRKAHGATVWAVVFTWPPGSGKEIERTTGERDDRRAQAKAAIIYARWITGEQQAPAQRYTSREPRDSTRELVKQWLTSGETTQRPRTLDEYARYFEASLCDSFPTLTDISPSSVESYVTARLRLVQAPTVRKELSALRALGRWAQPREDWDRRVPGIPKDTKGRKWHQRRRGKATPLSEQESQRFLGCLPEWSRMRNGHRWPIRARFRVAYETGLRPATLSALSVPEHWAPGATSLIITDEIDKAKYGREVPLTPAALKALSGVVASDSFAAQGGAGLLFGTHDYRSAVSTAAKSCGLAAHQVATLCPYDIRHARATHLGANPQADLNGMMAMFGWRQVTTASKYVHPPKRAASEMLARIQASLPAPPVGDEAAPATTPGGVSEKTARSDAARVAASLTGPGADDEPLTGFG